MKMSRLQAALDGFGEEDIEIKTRSTSKKIHGSTREKTVLIGGHFPPEVQKQLRMIAAEEGTTHQALLTEALTLLFRKKGKDIII